MKETHYKLKQRVTALFAAAVMLCSMLPGAALAKAAGAAAATACKPLVVNCVCQMKFAVCVTMSACC